LGSGQGWDQAHKTMAATIGPTPVRLSRSGRQARTRVVMAGVWSAISVFRSWMRPARARRLAATVAVSVSQAACGRSRALAVTSWRVLKPRSRLRSASGAATTSAWSWRWASVPAWTAERRAASRTCSAARWPAARGWASRSRPRPRGRPWSRRGVGLGAVAAGGPLGPVQFHHLLGMGSEEAGQSGAVATGASIATPAGLGGASPTGATAGSRRGEPARSPGRPPRRSRRRPRRRCGCLWVSSSTVSASMALR
jgi:hypothetical protein